LHGVHYLIFILFYCYVMLSPLYDMEYMFHMYCS
jgi:hypothetical protein